MKKYAPDNPIAETRLLLQQPAKPPRYEQQLPPNSDAAATLYVCSTSIRDVAQTSQMRKERSFPDGVRNGANRPRADLEMAGVEMRSAAQTPAGPDQNRRAALARQPRLFGP